MMNSEMRLHIPAVTNLIAHSLPLQDWGFTESAKTDSTIIYNSQWCRIKFVIEKDITEDHLHIYYGRLHASDNEQIMEWNGRKCYCWYHHADIKIALEFLDGVSPQNAYKWRRQPLPLFESYFNSEFAKSIDNAEERYLKLHAMIWEHYGTRFFELFDLRRPDLWEKYTQFIKEFYKIKGLNPDVIPSRDQIC